MMGNLIGGNNNHNVPAQPQSWAEYSATSGTVSYTHLDVYKRQVLSRM